MQHTWAIHTPRLTDFAELTNVWEASVRATHDFLPDSYIELLRGLVLEQYLDTVMLICCKDPTSKRITGFAGVAAGKVEMLFIHPDYRGLGIGKCLLMFAINELNAERLDVNEQNLQAVGFYLKQGFVAVGRCEKDGMGQPYPLLHLRFKRPARA
ncbi:GNAT family N-acetyltransferase [Pseudomonas fragi]|jgi:putative acetyltransferase|uniref:GNAT family N-acetyltransferase n=1 Tax=Pseudomonas fragi TaxID=296 RepID=A0A9Q5FM49_PSEFR|nr:GNAT family N-acetyltransferase [Pseudomonas fragi]MBM1199531.1 GNAT family N-acetyltransferase [Pseudomonas fragi]NNA85028.1 GNAT family N-acetyltransferase [Pseudomonas fragi]NNB09354.1 GNAT family N-acetyltransferase [Pseudomonas fragi]NNB26576.1 GNAT family N-acetyltransferase [Pseudomonas fragi]NNB33468.1 GNAT family N-acetyltransferase [Pseudomonas fragi]